MLYAILIRTSSRYNRHPANIITLQEEISYTFFIRHILRCVTLELRYDTMDLVTLLLSLITVPWFTSTSSVLFSLISHWSSRSRTTEDIIQRFSSPASHSSFFLWSEEHFLLAYPTRIHGVYGDPFDFVNVKSRGIYVAFLYSLANTRIQNDTLNNAHSRERDAKCFGKRSIPVPRTTFFDNSRPRSSQPFARLLNESSCSWKGERRVRCIATLSRGFLWTMIKFTFTRTASTTRVNSKWDERKVLVCRCWCNIYSITCGLTNISQNSVIWENHVLSFNVDNTVHVFNVSFHK